MTNKELREKIARLETELTEVKEMAEAMKKRTDGGVFKPEGGQKYWYISGSGEIYESWWENYPTDYNRYAIGNCFPTEQSAEDAVRVLKLIQKARESQDDFVPDWEDAVQYKYFLSFNSGDIYAAINWTTNVVSKFGYWENRSVCEQFIDENREELLWYFTEYRR